MHQVPFHDDAHVALSEIADISKEAPSMDTIRSANVNAIGVIKDTVATFSAA